MHPAYFCTRFRCDSKPDFWPDAFAILSAYATTGSVWSFERNTSADEAIRQVLVGQKNWMWRIAGYSPMTEHTEPSWATIMKIQDACDLGKLFLQDAIYWVDRDRLFVVQCDNPYRSVFVDKFSRRMDPC